MLSEIEDVKSTPDGTKNAINAWLSERQQVLVLYNQLTREIAKSPNIQPSATSIQGFCQILMDYVSAGHFEVYEHIVSQCEENGTSSIKLARSLYPKIAKTTDSVLEFNDKYSDDAFADEMHELDEDLSELGQKLIERMELEDRLINTLNTMH